MKPAFLTPDYTVFLTEVKGRIQSARLNAGRAVNRELVLLYWDIGRGIVEKQKALGWGDAVVESLARDLSEAFPGIRGFSASNLWRMRQLFTALTAPDFLAQLVRELAPKAKEPEILAQAVRELAGKDDVEVEFALRLKANPIGVAEHQLQSKLPAEFKGKLPTAQQLTAVVREILPTKDAL